MGSNPTSLPARRLLATLTGSEDVLAHMVGLVLDLTQNLAEAGAGVAGLARIAALGVLTDGLKLVNHGVENLNESELHCAPLVLCGSCTEEILA